MVLTSTGPIWISISDGNNSNRLFRISGVECKHDKSRVKRDRVQELWAKIQSVGAHKGILFATAGFQSGAIEFAKSHGIALVEIADGRSSYVVKTGARQVVEQHLETSALVRERRGGQSIPFAITSKRVLCAKSWL
jgi:hypothetical protein